MPNTQHTCQHPASALQPVTTLVHYPSCAHDTYAVSGQTETVHYPTRTSLKPPPLST